MDRLPRPLEGLLITPFDGGGQAVARYLVETGGGSFVVNHRMRCLIESLSLHSSLNELKQHLEISLGEAIDEQDLSTQIARLPAGLFDPAAGSVLQSPFHRSFRLFPAERVQTLARALRFLYAPAARMIVAGTFLFSLPWLFPLVARGLEFQPSPGDLWWLVVAMTATALLHELGHAAACAWHGVPAGEIGFGLYLVFPAFYTDVTKAWRLNRLQRAAVDLGGIYFQLILVLLLVPVARAVGGSGFLPFLILCNFYMILQNLNPLFKMDGYWLFSDLAGLPNLHQRTGHLFRRLNPWHPAAVDPTPLDQVRQSLVYGYGLAILAYAGFLLVTLPRWYGAQLAPYPAIAGSCIQELMRSLTAGNDLAALGSAGRLVTASFLPGLMVVLPAYWLLRCTGRLLRTDRS